MSISHTKGMVGRQLDREVQTSEKWFRLETLSLQAEHNFVVFYEIMEGMRVEKRSHSQRIMTGITIK